MGLPGKGVIQNLLSLFLSGSTLSFTVDKKVSDLFRAESLCWPQGSELKGCSICLSPATRMGTKAGTANQDSHGALATSRLGLRYLSLPCSAFLEKSLPFSGPQFLHLRKVLGRVVGGTESVGGYCMDVLH